MGIIVLAGIQVFGPARTNPQTAPTQALRSKVPVPPHIDAIFSRSCRDCHSNETRWPWYSHIAPISWAVVGDVNAGRDQMNFSDWRYSPEEGADLLDSLCKQVKRHRMPLPQYTWLHWNAKLSDDEIKQLCAWASDAAERLIPSH